MSAFRPRFSRRLRPRRRRSPNLSPSRPRPLRPNLRLRLSPPTTRRLSRLRSSRILFQTRQAIRGARNCREGGRRVWTNAARRKGRRSGGSDCLGLLPYFFIVFFCSVLFRHLLLPLHSAWNPIFPSWPAFPSAHSFDALLACSRPASCRFRWRLRLSHIDPISATLRGPLLALLHLFRLLSALLRRSPWTVELQASLRGLLDE